MNGTTPQLAPVGTILAFAGTTLPDSGWMLCDGRALDRTVFVELFAMIGTNFGAPNDDQYNVPDLRGMFLRGLSPAGAPRDPDGDLRTALLPGGNTGRNVGSFQTYGSAPAKTPFSALIPNVGNVWTRIDNTGKWVVAKVRSESPTVEQTAQGGDKESRPINKTAFFIIKYRSKNDDGSYVTVPIGAIVPFAGNNTAALQPRWRLCDGSVVSAADAPKLAAVLGKAHGGDASGTVLPDLRGFFLRGVSQGSGRDPDASRRTAPLPAKPPGDQGNSGDAVGSQQDYATGHPVKAPFGTVVPNLPNASLHCLEGGVRYVYLYTDASTLVPLTRPSGGGDKETRPDNMNVAWCIRVN